MLTVNSLSGGKTSSYIAAHYPADIDIFSLVCLDCHNAGGSLNKDKKLRQMVNDKLSKFIPQYGEFMATAEDPKTIKVMFDLEQHIGREITWVRGVSFETLIKMRKALPNMAWRFCTTELKIKPIFEHLFMYHELPCEMRIGYRYDELDRSIKDEFKASLVCEMQKSGRWIHRWEDQQWRHTSFPLQDDKICHGHIVDYWKQFNIEFPKDSNCQFCFWKQPEQHRLNFDENFPIMQWASIQEILKENTFKKDITLEQTKQLWPQYDLFTGDTSAGCQAGFCTS